MTDQTAEKWMHLTQILQQHTPLAIAFSGGVDSSLLVAYAKTVLGDQVMAVTLQSPVFSQEERQDAHHFCQALSVPLFLLDVGEESLQSIRDNPPNRCYLCKKALFSRLQRLAQEKGASVLADGTNADDLQDYRPGLQALDELGVISPLKEVGLTKMEIRQWLRDHGYALWNKPSCACLASRIPYGEPITTEKLTRIDALEHYLHQLGLLQCRVRHHQNLARIEVPPENRSAFFDTDLMDQIHHKAKDLGFSYASLDLCGYRTGSLNELL